MFFKLESYTLLHFNDRKNNINVDSIFSVMHCHDCGKNLETIKRFNETLSPTKNDKFARSVNHNDFIYHNDRPGHFPPRNMGFDKR